MMRPVTVLYEDSAADGLVKEYGPHLLVRRCVADRLGLSPWELTALEGHPKNGASKIRMECRRIPPQIGRDGRLVVAVYDADRIHRDVKLPEDACKARIKEILWRECSFREHLRIVLLVRNIETVVQAVCACAPEQVPEETRRLALDRKDRNARDIILKRAAFWPEPARREELLRRVPSLGYLVEELVEALASLRSGDGAGV